MKPVQIKRPLYWAYGDSAYQVAARIAEEEKGVLVIRDSEYQVLRNQVDILYDDEILENFGETYSLKERGYTAVGSQEYGFVWVRFVQSGKNINFDFLKEKKFFNIPDLCDESIWDSLSNPVQDLLNKKYGVKKDFTMRIFPEDWQQQRWREFIAKYPIGAPYSYARALDANIIGWASSLEDKHKVVIELAVCKPGKDFGKKIILTDIPRA